MRTGLLIADWEMSFTTSFKHTARVKYNVDFNSSNVQSIQENLQTLKANIQTGNINNVHVGYEFSLEEVNRIEQILNALLERYLEHFRAIPSNRKLYTLLQQLRDAEMQTPTEIAKEALQQILTPPTQKKVTRKEQLQADAQAMSRERMLNLIQKKSAKKGKN